MTLLEQQLDAFQAYTVAKLAMDADLTFDTARAAAKAWWEFLLVYEAECRRPSDKVLPFPISRRTTAPGDSAA